MKEDKKEEKKELNLEECQKQRDEYLAGWQRAKADLINFKREETERFQEIIRFFQEENLLKLLPILDNLNLAEKNLPEKLREDEHTQGLLNIKKQLEDLFKSQGVEEIKTEGKFDPNFHEAVEMMENKDLESGTVFEEVQKGYKINNRVLRPAKVKVIK
jgi:molecular chaperone GrpE